MRYYRKGFRAERELLRFLSSWGFSCIRSASSGGFYTPVDVVAIKKNNILCFEIKSWSKKPKLDKERLKRLKEWCETAGALGFLAWYNKNQWKFLPLADAEENRYDEDRWIPKEQFFKIFVFD